MDLELFKKFAKGKKEEITKSNDVWMYTRVSSKGQEDNYRLECQKVAAEEYAKEHELKIANTYGETYESASGDFTRKEFMRLIDNVRNAKVRPYAILIYKMNRFSRSGGKGITLADELVDVLNVHLIETSSGKTTETIRGKYEISLALLHAKEENISRLEHTIPGMKRFIKNGYWLGRAPRGYDHYGPRVADISKIRKEQSLILNEEGRLIQQAWKLKLQGERDFIILKFLHAAGINMSKQLLSDMWRNPFYCGILANSLLDGNVVEGKWEPMISNEDFWEVQSLLDGNKQGYQVDKVCAERPLQGFIQCHGCGRKMTGYLVKMKGVQVYKCQKCRDVSINANTTPRSHGIGVHNLFVDLLSQYQLNPELLEPFKIQMKMTMEAITRDNKNSEARLLKELAKHEEKRKNLNRLNMTGKIDDCDKHDYYDFKEELNTKISQIKCQLNDSPTKISNQDLFIKNSLDAVKNISIYWASGDIETKRRIQKLVFPEGLVIDTKKRTYLTKKVNNVFTLSKRISSDCVLENKNDSVNFPESSSFVAGRELHDFIYHLPIFNLKPIDNKGL